MNRKGQFYLIAALVVISLVAGAVAVYNSATAPDRETFFYSLQEEASYEAGQVINHGLYNSLSAEDINDNIEKLAKYYYSTNPDTDILTIGGNANNLTFKLYKNVAEGNLGIKYGDVEIFTQNNEVGDFIKTNIARNDT